MPSSGRYPRPPHGPRSRIGAAQAAPQARPEEALEQGAELGGTALLLAPAPARESDLRAARDGVRLQLRPTRRRLRLERDQRRIAELRRAEQRPVPQLADQGQAASRQPPAEERQ